MNLLFLGYWNADDPLTASTIIPHLRILSRNTHVSSLIFCSVQREMYSDDIATKIAETGSEFIPLFSLNFPLNLVNKLFDFILIPRNIRKLISSKKIDFIIARGAPAGALAYLATKRSNIRFVVESYEPHSEYMLESKVWHRLDPRYFMQKHWEGKINNSADYLLTVSANYRQRLLNNNIDEQKIKVARCAVDGNLFQSAIDSEIRNFLSIPENATVCVYAGKFGGLYYDVEVFQLLKILYAYFEKEVYFILLSNITDERLFKLSDNVGLDKNKIRKRFVSHDHVNEYLNCADFAIAPYRRTQSAKYLSPVKLGEYWAMGLPTILTDDVGDESEFIDQEKLGISLNFEELSRDNYINDKLDSLRKLLNNESAERIRKFALKYRSFEKIREIYDEILNELKL